MSFDKYNPGYAKFLRQEDNTGWVWLDKNLEKRNEDRDDGKGHFRTPRERVKQVGCSWSNRPRVGSKVLYLTEFLTLPTLIEATVDAKWRTSFGGYDALDQVTLTWHTSSNIHVENCRANKVFLLPHEDPTPIQVGDFVKWRNLPNTGVFVLDRIYSGGFLVDTVFNEKTARLGDIERVPPEPPKPLYWNTVSCDEVEIEPSDFRPPI